MKFNTQLLTELSKSKYLESFPNLKQKKTQEITTIVLTLITLSIFGIFAINPTLSTIAQLQREYADTLDVDIRLRQKIINLGQLQTQYENLKPDLPTVFSAIPQTPRPSELVAQFQVLGNNTSVSVSRIQTYQTDLITTSQGPRTTPSYAFSLTAEGTPENMYRFMDQIVEFERIITIDNLILSAGPQNSGLLELNLRGKAYFKP